MASRTLKAKGRARYVKRRQARGRKREWIVFAEYKGGPDERDDVCRSIVVAPTSGSGYDFVRGVRDLNWEFTSERWARQAASMLSWIRGVRVRISGPQDHTPRVFGTADGRSMQARRARKKAKR